jgi:hypothetical protein
MSSKSTYLAEVIESSLARFKSQCWEKNKIPLYGSLVISETGSSKLFGIVQSIFTLSDDPSRHIAAYQKTEKELLRDQPQIFAFIKTFFYTLVVGYEENGQIFYTFPSQPLALHAFVRGATYGEYEKFFKKHDYLHVLCGQASLIDSIDELLLAVVHNFKRNNVFEEVIDLFVDQYSILNSADYRRVKQFLERVE